MKWLRSAGLFTLFLCLGLSLGTRVGYTFYDYPDFNFTNTADPLQSATRSFKEASADDLGQRVDLQTPALHVEQTNYLVIMVNHLKDNSETTPVKAKSIWLVLSQPNLPTLHWLPLEPLTEPIPIGSGEELTAFLKQTYAQQGVVWDHYLIIDQAGLRISAYLLNQVINHLSRQSAGNSLVQMAERLTSQSSDLRGQAKWITRMCEIAPDALAHVEVNRFLNLLQFNYRTDLDRSQLKNALYELKTGGNPSTNCVFPTLSETPVVP